MSTESYLYNAYSEMKESLFGLTVKSSGHIFAKKGRKISREVGRDDWLLFYVAKGCEHFYLDCEIDAREGSFIFYRPHERQEHVYVGERTGEFFYIHFTVDESFESFGFESSRVYTASPSPLVPEMFERIISELQAKSPCYERICISIFLEIIFQLQRCTMEVSPGKKYDNTVSAVILSMNKEYFNPRPLEAYAEMCGMSKFHFLRVFKSITGTTPISYLNGIRLAHAEELLEDNTLTVAEISRRTGFSSQRYFTDAFKKRSGLSPSEYRDKYYRMR